MKNTSLNPLMGKEVKLEYVAIETQIKFLQGKVLTLVDATFQDKEQKKAFKSLINSAFSQQLTWILQLCAPETPITSREALQAEGIDVDAIERGAIPIE